MRQIANMLVYIEGQPEAASLDRAVAVARSAGTTLTIATVVRPARSHLIIGREGYDLEEIERLLVQERKRQLEDAIAKYADAGVQMTSRVYLGDPVGAIVNAVLSEGFDLLVKTLSPPKGLRQQMFGSIDLRLMRACPCPVSIGQPKPDGYSGRAVVAVDLDEEHELNTNLNQEILDSVALLLHKDFSEMEEVHIVHAWSLYGEQLLESGAAKLPPKEFRKALDEEEASRERGLQRLVESYRRTLDEEVAAHFNPKLRLLHGDPNIVIPKYVEEINADMLGMGTASRSGIKGLLIGNTAEAILNCVHCSVVVHKPKGFVAPGGRA